MAIEIASMLSTAKAAAVVVKEAGKIELYQQVLDLQQSMLEALGENTRLSAENAKLTQQNIELQQQLNEAKQQLARRAQMAFRDGAYWQVDGEKVVDGPFCPKCLDVDGKTVRMTDRHNGFNICVNCKHGVRNEHYREPPPRPPRRSTWGGL